MVLLDIGLPKLNGLEVARRLRLEPWGKGLVLVAVTGWGQEADRLASHQSGFDAHLVKPVDHATLMSVLAGLSGRVPRGCRKARVGIGPQPVGLRADTRTRGQA